MDMNKSSIKRGLKYKDLYLSDNITVPVNYNFYLPQLFLFFFYMFYLSLILLY